MNEIRQKLPDLGSSHMRQNPSTWNSFGSIELWFYGPINLLGKCWAGDFTLPHFSLAAVSVHILSSETGNALLDSVAGNGLRKYFMINLHEIMSPDPAGIEPATSWSPVGHSSNWSTEAGRRAIKESNKVATNACRAQLFKASLA